MPVFFFPPIRYIKKSLQEINDLYQRNENTSTYTNALIKEIDDLKEENKMKNRIIQLLVEHNKLFFGKQKIKRWQ